ncbi:MAG: ATP-dependent helicase [Candidatus Acidiferrales bacterium]
MNPTGHFEEGHALNAEQRAAVEHGEGPLLVVAGAGTGKTRVITERIRTLLERDASLQGENILGLTFTDKAAGEMKSRVVRAVGERAEGVWLGTFHKFCLEKILQRVNPEIQPLDEMDHQILLRRNIAELGLEHFRRLAEPAEFLKDFVTFFSRCQDELVTSEDFEKFVAELRRQHEERKNSLAADAWEIAEEELQKKEELARAYRVSERLLRERKLHTFGAQILQAVEMLRADAALLEGMREQYRYILVDEFQDTNIAQLELLALLAGERRNILAVGDDDQAIYRFRGASFGSFTIFLKQFCGAGEGLRGVDEKKFLVSLKQNYRSTHRILRVAGEVIGHNERSPLLPAKKLTTENPEGEKIRVVEFGGTAEEAEWVASEIERLHEAGAPWRSMAVLYRKHTHREQVAEALARRRIPYVIRKLSILSSTLVRDLLAYVRLIGAPGNDVACARVLAIPYWRLEPRDLARLAERAERNERRPLWDEVEAAENDPAIGSGKARIAELVAFVKGLRESARKKTASELLGELIAGLGVAPLESDADRKYLERFVEFVKEWEKKSEGKRLADFLEYLGYFDELGGNITLDEEISGDAVQLMTVHAAKGLEFPHVFILRVTKREFPSGERPQVLEFPEELMKEERPKGDFWKQEERRLFYVALTRAKRRLTLTTIEGRWHKHSPFLDDFLMNAKIQKLDTEQSAPKVEAAAPEEAAGPAADSKKLRLGRLFGWAPENARAYSHVALWARAYHPPRPEPLQLSASAIGEYESCPMKYMFEHMWKLRGGPHAQFTFGNVMHATIREFVREMRKRGKVPLDELFSIYDREWRSTGFPDDYQESEYRKAGREQLEAFHKSYSEAPARVLHQEKTFELPMENDVVVTGRMDQVNRIEKDEIEIVDYKTGRPRGEKKAAEDLQLSVYALAAREVLGAAARRLVFYNLATNERVETTRDDKALAATKERIAEVADLIRAGEFPAKKGYGCGYCDYKPLCPAHEQLLTIRPVREKSE